MAEITTTQAFSDGDTVTATKLNNITANAAIQTEAITNRSAETTVDQANDLLLMYDASATALKKVTLSNVIKAGTASNFPVTGNATIGGTLGVTGASTLSGNTTVGGTLGVTGASTLSGNTTVGGTLGVTGAITASSTINGTTIPTSKTLVTTDDTQTITGKTVNLASNTLAGTLAQFNTSCSDADFASLAGSETLTNKTIISSTGAFTDITLNSVKVDAFPAGTVLLFYQSSAPTGWTQVTTQNNKALRVVSGTGGGTGGSTGFTSVFTSRTPSTPSGTISVSGTVGNTTLTYNQIPAHSHALYMSSSGDNANLWHRALDNYPPASGDGTIGCTAYEAQLGVLNAGGGGSHNHSWSGSASFSGSAMTAMDFAVQYIDIILASKNA